MNLLTTREAAELMKLSPRTLEMHRSKGGGPAYLKAGGLVRYRLADLEAWLSHHTSTSSGPVRSTSDTAA